MELQAGGSMGSSNQLAVFGAIVLCFSLILYGCGKSEESIESDTVPEITDKGNFIFVGDNLVLNKEYIIRIQIYDYTWRPTQHDQYGWHVEAVMMGNVYGEFLGGSASASKVKIFKGTRSECQPIFDQVITLLPE